MFVLFNWVILHNMFSGNFWLTLPIKTKTWPSGYKGLYMIWSSSYDIMIVVGYVEQERKPENIWILVKHIKKCNSCLSQEAISQAKISVRALFSSLVCQGFPLLPLSCLSHASIISYISPVLSLCHSKGPPSPHSTCYGATVLCSFQNFFFHHPAVPRDLIGSNWHIRMLSAPFFIFGVPLILPKNHLKPA